MSELFFLAQSLLLLAQLYVFSHNYRYSFFMTLFQLNHISVKSPDNMSVAAISIRHYTLNLDFQCKHFVIRVGFAYVVFKRGIFCFWQTELKREQIDCTGLKVRLEFGIQHHYPYYTKCITKKAFNEGAWQQ